MQLAPTMTDLTFVLARMDFLVTEKPAKVGKFFFQMNFSCKFDQDLDPFCDALRTFYKINRSFNFNDRICFCTPCINLSIKTFVENTFFSSLYSSPTFQD